MRLHAGIGRLSTLRDLQYLDLVSNTSAGLPAALATLTGATTWRMLASEPHQLGMKVSWWRHMLSPMHSHYSKSGMHSNLLAFINNPSDACLDAGLKALRVRSSSLMTDEVLAAVARVTSLTALFLVEAIAAKFELPTRYGKQASWSS